MLLIPMSLNNFYSPKELCKFKVYASQYFVSLHSSLFFDITLDIGHPDSSNTVFVGNKMLILQHYSVSYI